MDGLKAAMAANPIFWIVVLVIIIVVVIIVIVVGTIGFFTYMPGAIRTKLNSTVKNIWGTLSGGDSWIDPHQVSEVKKYLVDMGYDLVRFWFCRG